MSQEPGGPQDAKEDAELRGLDEGLRGLENDQVEGRSESEGDTESEPLRPGYVRIPGVGDVRGIAVTCALCGKAGFYRNLGRGHPLKEQPARTIKIYVRWSGAWIAVAYAHFACARPLAEPEGAPRS